MADENVPFQAENLGVEIDAELYRFNQKGVPYEIIDSAVAEVVIKKTPLMIIAGKPYVYQDGVYRADPDEIFMHHLIRSEILSNLVTDFRIVRVCRLIMKDLRLQVDVDDVNQYPVRWVNFKNGMVDFLTGELHPHSPSYRSVSQIPHRYIPGLDITKTTYFRFLQSRLDNESQRQLLEYQAVCLLHNNFVQKFLMLVGQPNSGKSAILNFTSCLVGRDNIAAVPLQALGERFTTASLLLKTLNVCGDLSNTALKDTSVIKQLTGEDLIKGEFKGGKIFFFKNRARFLFSANELPAVLDERSNGFYRRLMVIRFGNEGEYIPDLYERLNDESEIETVISHLVERGKVVLQEGKVFESEGSLREISQLKSDSDSVEAFLESAASPDKKSKVRRPDLFAAYVDFCQQEDRISLGKTAFFKALRTKGFREVKSCGENYICGLSLDFMGVDETPFD